MKKLFFDLIALNQGARCACLAEEEVFFQACLTTPCTKARCQSIGQGMKKGCSDEFVTSLLWIYSV